MMWTSMLTHRALSGINIYCGVFGWVHLPIKNRANLHAVLNTRLMIGVVFLLRDRYHHRSSITDLKMNQWKPWMRTGKGRVDQRLLICGGCYVHKELARLLVCWRQKSNTAFGWRICWWFIYFVLTEVIRHAIGKCCSPSFCKTDRESSNTKEGITKSGRFRLKKVDRIQGFELINDVLCFCK